MGQDNRDIAASLGFSTEQIDAMVEGRRALRRGGGWSVGMTDRYAVIGNPIGFTKSPLIHSPLPRDRPGHRIHRDPRDDRRVCHATLTSSVRDGAQGLNITAPFKLDAFAYATDLSESARRAGAANCLKFDGDHVICREFRRRRADP